VDAVGDEYNYASPALDANEDADEDADADAFDDEYNYEASASPALDADADTNEDADADAFDDEYNYEASASPAPDADADADEDAYANDEYKYEASASPALGALPENARSRVHALDDDYSYGQIECEDAEFVDAGGDACLRHSCMRPSAASVCGLKLLVYAASSY
jgi:hypothetical protein